jgi:hypothetical protein
VPPHARAALSSSRLLAMAKPVAGGSDGIRPLAVGEVLHRLVARAVGLQYGERFSVTLDEIRCLSARRVRKPRLAFQQT